MYIRVTLSAGYSKGPSNEVVTINVENIKSVSPMSGEEWHTWIWLKNPGPNGEKGLLVLEPCNEVKKQLYGTGIELTDY